MEVFPGPSVDGGPSLPADPQGGPTHLDGAILPHLTAGPKSPLLEPAEAARGRPAAQGSAWMSLDLVRNPRLGSKAWGAGSNSRDGTGLKRAGGHLLHHTVR
jgi:hypothetical protein